MPYPYPTSVNLTENPTGLFNYLNTVSNNWFSNMLLIAIYIIFAVGFYSAKRNFMGALAVAGFSTFVISILFWIAGLISTATFVIVTAVAILSFASLWISDR